MQGLTPVNDCVLVKLEDTHKNFNTTESKYDTRTQGIIVNFGDMTNNSLMTHDLLNKRVYFEEYKEGARIKRDGELFCFIKISDIRGYEDV